MYSLFSVALEGRVEVWSEDGCDWTSCIMSPTHKYVVVYIPLSLQLFSSPISETSHTLHQCAEILSQEVGIDRTLA